MLPTTGDVYPQDPAALRPTVAPAAAVTSRVSSVDHPRKTVYLPALPGSRTRFYDHTCPDQSLSTTRARSCITTGRSCSSTQHPRVLSSGFLPGTAAAALGASQGATSAFRIARKGTGRVDANVVCAPRRNRSAGPATSHDRALSTAMLAATIQVQERASTAPPLVGRQIPRQTPRCRPPS